MTIKKTKSHENAIYAIENNLKRLKHYYREVPQKANFNKYIKYHKDYMTLKNKFENTPLESKNYKVLREICNDLDSLWFNYGSYKFPNLYHYEVEKIRELISAEKRNIYDVLPSYEFYVTGSNRTVNDSDGTKTFKTAYDMWRTFKSYHDLDTTAKIVYDGKVYFPCDREDCISIFSKIEDMEALQDS